MIGLVWFVLAISLRINNSIYFYTMGYGVRRVLFGGALLFLLGTAPSVPDLLLMVTAFLQLELGICSCFFYLKKIDFLMVNLSHLRKEGQFFPVF